MTPFADAAVKSAFEAFPEDSREQLMRLRELIWQTARETPGVGELEETLKWGQPSLQPKATRTGTPLRLGLPRTGGFAIFVHCQTTVIADFQAVFGTDFRFDGNRAVLFDTGDVPDQDKLRLLIRDALTYHLPE